MDKLKSLWFNKYSLFAFAFIIVSFSIWYTHQLATVIKQQEISQANDLANAYHILISNEVSEVDMEKALETIKTNKNIPIVWTDGKNNILSYNNFDDKRVASDSNYLKQQIKFLKKNRIQINIDANQKHFLYYKDSELLQKIKKYPYYQLILVVLFFLISFIAFASIRRAEQNQVWVGLAKETAHQLGTPISSLSAWIEILNDKLTDEEGLMMVDEMKKDVDRLDLVAKRFSKIGSTPELTETFVVPIIESTVDYMKKRAAHAIHFQIKDITEGKAKSRLNSQLFEWVLENLMKNALDAMSNKGKIEFIIFEDKEWLIIDVKDSGKGIPTNQFETVFNTGFSTKNRGWGLGLALSKRIIQSYHNGKIFVKESVVNKGTTFRIMLKQI